MDPFPRTTVAILLHSEARIAGIGGGSTLPAGDPGCRLRDTARQGRRRSLYYTHDGYLFLVFCADQFGVDDGQY